MIKHKAVRLLMIAVAICSAMVSVSLSANSGWTQKLAWVYARSLVYDEDTGAPIWISYEPDGSYGSTIGVAVTWSSFLRHSS